MSTNVVVLGACGRMGQQISQIVLDDPDCTLAGCTEIPGHARIGDDIGVVLGRGECGVAIVDSLASLDLAGTVIIDFTSPESTVAVSKLVRDRSAGHVVCTTGLTDADKAVLHETAKQTAVMFSPNMSRGMNLMFHLAGLAAKKLGLDFDVEIIEAHHRFKKDSPSGTAIKLGEVVAEARDAEYADVARHGREGMVGERTSEEIGMHAVRGGDIVGDHTVLFAGPAERIELRHVAHSRGVFAQGAVAGAKWLSGQSAGMYTMADALEF